MKTTAEIRECCAAIRHDVNLPSGLRERLAEVIEHVVELCGRVEALEAALAETGLFREAPTEYPAEIVDDPAPAE